MTASSTSAEHPGAAASADKHGASAAPQFTGKYLSLESFRRDGTGVATPVWFVTENGKILVVTDDGSYKVRRIRRNPAVTVAECTAAGRLRGPRVPHALRYCPSAKYLACGSSWAASTASTGSSFCRSTASCKPSPMAAAHARKAWR